MIKRVLVRHCLQTGTQVDVDGFSLSVGSQAGFSKLSSETALLNASEWDTYIRDIGTVHPDHARVKFRCSSMASLDVLREQCGA